MGKGREQALVIRQMQTETMISFHLIPDRISCPLQNHKCLQGCREKGAQNHCRWGYKLGT